MERRSSRPQQPARRWARLGIEKLEARELPASNLGATFGSGILHITGAGSNDQITVQESKQQLSVQGTTITSGSQTIASVPLSQVKQIDVSFGGTTLAFPQLQNLPSTTVEVEQFTKAGKVDTLYQNGLAYQQNTFDSAGNLVRQVKWNASGEVDTRYTNGKMTQQDTFNAAGACLEIVKWSASGKVDTFFTNGKASLQNVYNASGNLTEKITWSASGEVDTVYRNGRVYQQTTWNADYTYAEQVTWDSAGNKMDVLFHNGTAYQRRIWYATGIFTLETWSPTGQYTFREYNAAGQLIASIG